MVWALIIAIVLFSPNVAYAEPLENDVSVSEDAADLEEDTTSSPEPDGDNGESEPDSEPEVSGVDVALAPAEDVVTYSPTGELLSTTAEPVLLGATSYSSPYASVTSNTYSDIAAHMLTKIGWSDDYVFWRSGQYSYTLAYGPIELSGTNQFSGDSVCLVTFSLDSGYSGTYTLARTDGALALNTGSYIVFSSLGDFPVLDYEPLALWNWALLGTVAACCSLVRPLFGFVCRMGVRVHGSHES